MNGKLRRVPIGLEGIASRNGLTHDDLSYLEVLANERKPVGERVITAEGMDAFKRIKARLAELPLSPAGQGR